MTPSSTAEPHPAGRAARFGARLGLTAILAFAFGSEAVGQTRVLELRERARLADAWLAERLDTVLPMLMRRTGIDMWLIMAREYNEDPVMRTMLPSTWLSARRRTLLMVFDPGGEQPLETLAVSRYDVGDRFSRAWDKERHGSQWARLTELIAERQPRRIGINVSPTFALADGLTHSEHQALKAALPEDLQQRLVSAEALAIGWLETRTANEMTVYRQICRIAHEIIATGLSEQVVQPGVTTTDDVAWWYRERIAQRGLTAWFHPSVGVQRAGEADANHKQEVLTDSDNVIQPGDLLHVDFGLTYLRLNTDTQQHAYVLQAGETDAPEALRRALARGNRLQDILTGHFKAGRTGNEILAAALEQAEREGIEASIYTHPIGYHGHGAGPTIGLWDQQDGVPGRGDYPLYPNTAHSIELYAASEVPDWNRKIRIKLEEDAFFDGTEIRYIDGRQTELLLIPRSGR